MNFNTDIVASEGSGLDGDYSPESSAMIELLAKIMTVDLLDGIWTDLKEIVSPDSMADLEQECVLGALEDNITYDQARSYFAATIMASRMGVLKGVNPLGNRWKIDPGSVPPLRTLEALIKKGEDLEAEDAARKARLSPMKLIPKKTKNKKK